MQETFVGDTIKLILKTSLVLSGYEDFLIKYKKPDGTTGEFIAAISSEDTKWLEVTLDVNDLDQAGEWTLQACIKDDSEAVILHGKFVNLMVKEPITIDVV